jgi:hypothetical protein
LTKPDDGLAEHVPLRAAIQPQNARKARYFDEFESRGNTSSIMLSVRADKTSF